MSLSEHMDGILSRCQGEDIRRRDGSLAVWDIGGPGLFARHRRQRREAVVACRRELLSNLLAWDAPIFLMHEPPQEYDVPGNWQPVSEGTWCVPPDFNLDHPAVNYWLFALGNWRVYSAPSPVQGIWPDAFRCSAAELLAWMSAKWVQALIDSFHDDTDWVVALSTAEADGDRPVGFRRVQGS